MFSVEKNSLREFNRGRSFFLGVQALHIPYSEKFDEKLLSSVNHFVTTGMVYRNIPVLVSGPYQIGMVPLGTLFFIQYAVFFGAPHW